MIYYNVPSPISFDGVAAYCVGAFYSEDKGLRLIVKRDLSIRLSSLSVSYRFSAESIRKKDPDNPYYTRSYDKELINEKEYLVIGAKTPEFIPDGVTAVISSVILENGEKIQFKIGSYADADTPSFSHDYIGASREYLEYFDYRKKSREAPATSGTAQNKSTAVSALARKAAEVILTDEIKKAAESTEKKKPKKKKSNKNIVTAAAVSVFALIIGGVILGGLFMQSVPTAPSVSSLIEKGEFAAAYKTAMAIHDTKKAQEICESVASDYIAEGEYSKAYLYAKAAPEPFDTKLIEDYVALLVSQGRGEEAYKFLADKDEYSEIGNEVLTSLIDGAIEIYDYKSAFEYASSDPEVYEAYVMQKLAEFIVADGRVNYKVFDALEALDDRGPFDRMAKTASESLESSKSYIEAAALASQIADENEKREVMKSVSESGVTYYVSKRDFSKAIELYDFSSSMLDDETKSRILTTALASSERIGESAGIILFKNRIGENTSGIVVKKEDESIRAAFSSVWFLLTADQKKSYHAREMDIYNEAFRIENGSVAGVSDAVSVAVSEKLVAVLKKDGSATTATVNRYSTVSIPAGGNYVGLDAGREHVLLLTDDGHVTAYGANGSGQCNTGEWENVVKVAAGADFSVALRSDGTLYATGDNSLGQCKVDGITGVIDIAANDRAVVLLMRDGKVKLLGDVSMGLTDAQLIENVKLIRAGGSGIAVLNSRGVYSYFCGAKKADSVYTDSWKNLRELAVGSVSVSRIDQNGKMTTEGEGAPITHPGYDHNEQ